MSNSRVNADFDFNRDKWVVSLVNSVGGTGGMLGGHAVIVVEGMDGDGNLFQGEYDIAANSFPEQQEMIQSALGNTMGYITRIRCSPTAINRTAHPEQTANFHRNYEQCVGKSYYAQPHLALQMIASIEADAQVIDDEIAAAQRERRDVQWPIKYQKAGSYRWGIWGGNGGENCITWAEKKLAIAGVGNGKKAFDSKKASPFAHTTSCVLL